MSWRKAHKKGLATYCPACGSDIFFRRLHRRGSHVTCHQCHSLLEVSRLAPLTLEWAFEEPLFDSDFSPRSRHDSRDKRAVEDYGIGGDDFSDEWDDRWDEGWDEEEFEE